jgi:hypothetical protein
VPRRRVPAIERVMIAVMIRFALRFDNETAIGSGIRTALRTETLLPKFQTQPDPACPTSCALTTVSTFSSGKTSLFMTIVNNRRFHCSEASRPGPNGDSIGTADADPAPGPRERRTADAGCRCGQAEERPARKNPKGFGAHNSKSSYTVQVLIGEIPAHCRSARPSLDCRDRLISCSDQARRQDV